MADSIIVKEIIASVRKNTSITPGCLALRIYLGDSSTLRRDDTKAVLRSLGAPLVATLKSNMLNAQ